jgi:hypothetical protein
MGLRSASPTSPTSPTSQAAPEPASGAAALRAWAGKRSPNATPPARSTGVVPDARRVDLVLGLGGIAAELGVSLDTLKRWRRKADPPPVHKSGRNGAYSYRGELQAWVDTVLYPRGGGNHRGA